MLVKVSTSIILFIFYFKIVGLLRVSRIICKAGLVLYCFGKNQSMSFLGQWNVQPFMQYSFFSTQCTFILGLNTHFLQGLSNKTADFPQNILCRWQFIHLTYIVRGTACLNLDTVSDEMFWQSNTSLILFKIFWQMGKLFQSELSNTLLQYFASQKKMGKVASLFLKITSFHSPWEQKGLHSVTDYSMRGMYVKNSCNLNGGNIWGLFPNREHLLFCKQTEPKELLGKFVFIALHQNLLMP